MILYLKTIHKEPTQALFRNNNLQKLMLMKMREMTKKMKLIQTPNLNLSQKIKSLLLVIKMLEAV